MQKNNAIRIIWLVKGRYLADDTASRKREKK